MVGILSRGAGGAEDFALAGGWAGEAFGLEADGGEEASDSSFGAVGGEDGAGVHGVVYSAEYGFLPHLRLFLGSEGVEVDDIQLRG